MRLVTKIFPNLMVICFTALLIFGIGREVQAAWLWNHLWVNSNFTIGTWSAGSMTTAMSNAASNYHNSTDLNWTGTGGLIQGYENNFGATGYQGYAYPSNASGQNCYWYPTPIATGNCNTTTNKATSAVLYFNTYYGYSDREWLARHEMGHVFGLYHPPCGNPTVTVMHTPGCGSLPTTLQADEINWINSAY